MMILNKNYRFIFIFVGFISCLLLGCLNRTSGVLSSNQSGIYFFIISDHDGFVGYLSVPKDNKGVVACVDKDECSFEEEKEVGVSFVENLEESKIYKIDDSIKLSSKIEVIRDGGNKRKMQLVEGSSLSDVSIGDLKIIQLDKVSSKDLGGEVLNDIANHYIQGGNECTSYTEYADSELPTYAHEATHGLNSCIKNNKNTTGREVNGFYLLEGRAVVVEEPNIRKSVVASYVPNNLRNLGSNNRFNMYVKGMSSRDNQPLYIFDEWVAYINGAKQAISLSNQSKLSNEFGLAHGAIEFMVYSSALMKAVSEKDPSSFKNNTQLKALYKYLAKTTMEIYNQGKGKSQLVSSEAETYMNNFKNSDLYSFVK